MPIFPFSKHLSDDIYALLFTLVKQELVVSNQIEFVATGSISLVLQGIIYREVKDIDLVALTPECYNRITKLHQDHIVSELDSSQTEEDEPILDAVQYAKIQVGLVQIDLWQGKKCNNEQARFKLADGTEIPLLISAPSYVRAAKHDIIAQRANGLRYGYYEKKDIPERLKEITKHNSDIIAINNYYEKLHNRSS